jgi:predicted aspartyl protease
MPSVKCGFDSVPGGASGAELLVFYGPTLLVDIGFDVSFQQASGRGPTPGMSGIHALVDTGATESCIDSALAAHLNLPVIDRRNLAGAHGAQAVNIHMAQVHVAALNFTIYGTFAGVHLMAGGSPHRALIGRTFLQRYKMVYEGNTGTVTLSTP